MKKPIWLLAIIGVALGFLVGVLQNHATDDPLAKLFPEEKLKGAVPDVRVSIIGNLTTKSITGGEVILAQAVVPRHIEASEISPTALNALRGILRQNKADWICLYVAEDSALAITSNWVAVAEYQRGKISISGGPPSPQQIDSLKTSRLPILRPDSAQTRLVLEVFDSLRLRSDRWKLSQTLRGASSASLNREEFFKLQLDTRMLFDIGKKHGMSGDQVRTLVLGVTRYYWLRAGLPL